MVIEGARASLMNPWVFVGPAVVALFCTSVVLTPNIVPVLNPPPISHSVIQTTFDVEYRARAVGDDMSAPATLTHNTVDVYYPWNVSQASDSADTTGNSTQSEGRPVLFFVHGGGWKRGHSRSSEFFGVYGNLGYSFAKRGYVVVVANYRKSIGPSAVFQMLLVAIAAAVAGLIPSRWLGVQPSNVQLAWILRWLALSTLFVGIYWARYWLHLSRLGDGLIMHPSHSIDVGRALAWTTTSIAQFGGDPRTIVVMGHSAGAHILSMLLIEPNLLRKAVGGAAAESRIRDAVDAAVLVGGPFSGALLKQSWIAPSAVLYPVFGSDESKWEPSFPAWHCQNSSRLQNLGLPPMLIVNAEREVPGTWDADKVFLPLVKAGGVPARHVMIPGSNHFDSVLLVGAFFSPAERILVGETLNFTRTHLGRP
eukprot:m.213155 g.213155  ORF g.213155 m.213155 type:complete len:423 (-) comp15516_c1_seq1:311-1579(-)